MSRKSMQNTCNSNQQNQTAFSNWELKILDYSQQNRIRLIFRKLGQIGLDRIKQTAPVMYKKQHNFRYSVNLHEILEYNVCTCKSWGLEIPLNFSNDI